jgi:hypothetical protein
MPLEPVPYPQNTTYVLWVQDMGDLEGFQVYIGGHLYDEVADGSTHRYTLPRLESRLDIRVVFGGTDGGKSAIVVKTSTGNKVVKGQSGLEHGYQMVPV